MVPTTINEHRRIFLPATAFKRAAVIASKVLRNVFAGSALSSLFAYIVSHGNLFVPVTSQPYDQFVASNSASFVIILAMTLVVFLSTTLIGETFTAKPNLTRPQKLLMCCHKLARRLGPHVALASAASFLFVYHVTFKAFESKLGMYFTSACGCYLTVCADVHARHLVKTETERGRMRELKRQQRKRQQRMQQQHEQQQKIRQYQPHANGEFSRSVQRRQRRSNGRQSNKLTFKYALRTAIIDTPMVISTMLSIGYVHAVMLLVDISKQWQFAAFTVCSMILKIGAQEATKVAILKQSRSPPKRLVLVLVATPTILIETQVRVYQLRLSTNSVKVISIVGIALAEIAIRIFKLLAVKKLLRGRSRIPTENIALDSRLSSGSKRITSGGVEMFPIAPRQSRRRRHDTGKLLMFHTAETYADMYAEYIALGCSYAMFVCFSEHPYFAFDAGSRDTSYSSHEYWSILLLQIVIEVTVDIVACMCEILLGVPFEDFDQDSDFIFVLMALLACQNIGASAGLYFKKPDDTKY